MASETTFAIRGDLITLGQLIKALDLVTTGGEVKEFLEASYITVNGEEENRRGRKLRVGDRISIADSTIVELTQG